MAAYCLNCSATLATAEGASVLMCCEDCFNEIMKPFSDNHSRFAMAVRKEAQKGIHAIFSEKLQKWSVINASR
jgi:hypothetical protein